MTLRLKVWCSTDWANRAAHSIILIFNAGTLCNLITWSCPFTNWKTTLMINTKPISIENSPLRQGPRFQGLSHRGTRGRETLETSWLERARFCAMEKQSKFNCKRIWRKRVLFLFSSHCIIATNTMICWFCFRFSTEIPTAILSSITSLPGLSRPCTSVFIPEPGMDGYPWEPRFMDAQVLNYVCLLRGVQWQSTHVINFGL